MSVSTFPGTNASDTTESSSFANYECPRSCGISSEAAQILSGSSPAQAVHRNFASIIWAHPGMPLVAAPDLIKMILAFDSRQVSREALMAGISENKLTSK